MLVSRVFSVLGLSLLSVFALMSSGCESSSVQYSDGYASRFGVMSPGDDGKYHVYAETTVIHRLVDKGYVHGFEVVRKGGGRFMGYFEVEFPEPIEVTPELEANYIVKENGRILQSLSEIHWGLYSSPFWFSEGDPLGTYKLSVYIDEKLHRVFEYEVVPFGSDEQVEF